MIMLSAHGIMEHEAAPIDRRKGKSATRLADGLLWQEEVVAVVCWVDLIC